MNTTMYRWAAMLCLLVSGVVAAERDGSHLAGNWSGLSLCVARNTACHDETVVFHLTEIPGKPGWVSVSADKIVDGKAINMGTLEFRYDPDEQMLVCESPARVWRLKVDGNNIQGTLTEPGNVVIRRINLRRDPKE